MTVLRKLFLSKHTTRDFFTSALHRALCGTILLALFLVASHQRAEAFSQKAVDRLLETQKCMRCDLREANLAGKDLRESKLVGAYLIGAKLAGVNFAGADLRGAFLLRANLRRASLEGANLRGARLLGADLSNANLRKTDLQNAQLGRVILTGSSLREANFSGANMSAAKLDRVRHIKQEQINQACGNAKTILPPGISIPPCLYNAK